MSYRGLLTQTVTVRHRSAGAKDAHGNPANVFDAGTPYPAHLSPLGTGENENDRSFLTSDWLLYLEAGAVIGGRDRVVDGDGRTFEVIGPPTIARSSRGEHHVEARLRAVEGQ